MQAQPRESFQVLFDLESLRTVLRSQQAACGMTGSALTLQRSGLGTVE